MIVYDHRRIQDFVSGGGGGQGPLGPPGGGGDKALVAPWIRAWLFGGAIFVGGGGPRPPWPPWIRAWWSNPHVYPFFFFFGGGGRLSETCLSLKGSPALVTMDTMLSRGGGPAGGAHPPPFEIPKRVFKRDPPKTFAPAALAVAAAPPPPFHKSWIRPCSYNIAYLLHVVNKWNEQKRNVI